MAATDLPSPSELHKYLSYDPDTGEFTWKERTVEMFSGQVPVRDCKRWNAIFAGKPALVSVREKGYLYGEINSVKVRAHRAAYAMMTGSWPEEQIDHINGIRADNRWSNLRDASPTDNARNMAQSPRNTSGDHGVNWDVRSQKWRAQIGVDNRKRHLGYFASKDDAIAERQRANMELGFSERHGTAA